MRNIVTLKNKIMPLTWDVSNVADAYRKISKDEYEALEKKRTMFPNPSYHDKELDNYFEMTTLCNMLIHICGMFIGIPEITEDNYEKVAHRILVQEKLHGSYLYVVNPKTNEKEPNPITLEQVKNHIGLKTNGSEFNKTQFIKRQLKMWSL